MKCEIAVFLSCLLLQHASSQDPSTDEQEYFIKQIFSLYGDENQLSFEGLEHLMENLGLGGLKFDKKHNISMHKNSDGSFIEVHDSLNLHKHNHTRQERSITLPVLGLEEKCLSPETLLTLYGLEPGHRVSITHQGFMRICPAIVYQLDRRACITPDVLIHLPSASHQPSLTYQAWLGASLSILLISIAGMIGVLVVPFLQRYMFRHFLSTLVAVAVGTLTGDALIHLLPHAYGVGDNEETLLMSSTAFISLMGFFIVEAFINIIHELKKKRKEKRANKKISTGSGDYNKVQSKGHHDEQECRSLTVVQKDGCELKEINNKDEHEYVHEGVMSMAWMIVSGDGLHNLTDGLAVGAAFRADLVSGMATAIAVLSHELPHELGDFAVLLNSGMTVKQALLCNVFSSVLSFLGMAIGVMLGNIQSATRWIYCVAAGTFLYIGLADLIPELHRGMGREKESVITMLLCQIFGFFIGGAIMYVIALYEDSISEMLKDL